MSDMVLRSRSNTVSTRSNTVSTRSGLSDISNTLGSTLTNLASRVMPKRRTSGPAAATTTQPTNEVATYGENLPPSNIQVPVPSPRRHSTGATIPKSSLPPPRPTVAIKPESVATVSNMKSNFPPAPPSSEVTGALPKVSNDSDVENCDPQEETDHCSSPLKRHRSADQSSIVCSPSVMDMSVVRPTISPDHEEMRAAAEVEFFGFALPPKKHRRNALHTRAAPPNRCLDIVDDMYAFHFASEATYAPTDYFTRQPALTSQMRAILVDWLVELHYKYRLCPETLWRALSILDRFLATAAPITRNRLQLTGITSLVIACKFEELCAPTVADCVHLTNGVYPKSEVLAMEAEILGALNYDLAVPTGFHFLARFLEAARATEAVSILSSYTAERSMQEVDSLQWAPRVYAAASIMVAMAALGAGGPPPAGTSLGEWVWTKDLEAESGLTAQEVMECARILARRNAEPATVTARRTLDSVVKKYNNRDCLFASKFDWGSVPPL